MNWDRECFLVLRRPLQGDDVIPQIGPSGPVCGFTSLVIPASVLTCTFYASDLCLLPSEEARISCYGSIFQVLLMERQNLVDPLEFTVVEDVRWLKFQANSGNIYARRLVVFRILFEAYLHSIKYLRNSNVHANQYID